MVNSAGLFLNGWPVTDGMVNQNTLTPIQVSQTVLQPDRHRECQHRGKPAGHADRRHGGADRVCIRRLILT